MIKMYSDRERTKQCDLNCDDTLVISYGEYYIMNEDNSNPQKVKVYNDSKVYAYGEGVHIEAYDNACVTLFDGAVATLNDNCMLRLDHRDPNNGYSEGGFRVYRDLRNNEMVGSFMYQWGSNTVRCWYGVGFEIAAYPIWDFCWFNEFQEFLYVAFRGGDQPRLWNYHSLDTKTCFEYESNKDIGFKIRLRDMSHQEYTDGVKARNIQRAKYKSIFEELTGGNK